MRACGSGGYIRQQHATQIMEAARAGKAIFCEKPISLNLDIIDEVCSVVEETGALCMVAFQRRCGPLPTP